MMDVKTLKPILESLIMASAKPISVARMLACFSEKEVPDQKTLRSALKQLGEDYAKSSVELKEVSSGYRFQVGKDYASWVAKLWEDKPARYSRALLETLSLVAYKQPISRGEIEKIRGVSVSTQIMKTLIEREWVHIVGHRDVPGKPAIYATTKAFLDYFNLTSLDELPPLAEIKDIDKINGELDLLMPPGESSEKESKSVSGDGADSIVDMSVEDEATSTEMSATVVKMDVDDESISSVESAEDKTAGDTTIAKALSAEH